MYVLCAYFFPTEVSKCQFNWGGGCSAAGVKTSLISCNAPEMECMLESAAVAVEFCLLVDADRIKGTEKDVGGKRTKGQTKGRKLWLAKQSRPLPS